MKFLFAMTALLTLSGTYSTLSAQAAKPSPVKPGMRRSDLVTRTYFQPNRGQADADVEYVARMANCNVSLNHGGVKFASGRGSAGNISVTLIGANPKPASVTAGKQSGVNSYFGMGGRKDIVGIPGYGRVRYDAVYKNIDVTYYVHDGNVENDFELAPGARVDEIRMHIDGNVRLTVDSKGNLRDKGKSSFTYRRPEAYQIVDGKRKSINCAYRMMGESDAGFTLGNFDKTRPLVIDPILSFNPPPTMDAQYGVVTDASGNVYTAGQTYLEGAFENGAKYLAVGILDEYSPSGDLLFETQIGHFKLSGVSNGASNTHGLAVDAAGNAFLVGLAIPGFQCTANAFRSTMAPDSLSASVIKVASGGGRISYASLIDEKNLNTGITAIAVGPADHIYLTGTTPRSDFPTTPGALARMMPPAKYGRFSFLMVLDPARAGDAGLVYSSYISGSRGVNFSNGIAVDAAGCAYVCGSENDSGFPTTPGAYEPERHGGGGRAWLVKVDPRLSGKASLVYGTYVEGAAYPDSEGFAVVLDSAGSAYLAGYSLSGIHTTPGSAQPGFGGGTDAFIVKFNPSGSGVEWATNLGGSDQDYMRGLALDAQNNVYVFGHTRSKDYPLTPDALQTGAGNADDAAVFTELSSDGSHILFSTYLHDDRNDIGRGIAIDPMGNVYIVGESIKYGPGELLGGTRAPFFLKLYRASK